MRMANCRLAPRDTFRFHSEDGIVMAAIRSQLYLCRLYDCALAVKKGSIPSRIRFLEKQLIQALHSDSFCLSGIASSSFAHQDCEICGVAKAIKYLASSRFAEQCSAFMESTQGANGDDLIFRIGYDLSPAIRQYIEGANMPEHSARRHLMARAGMLAHALHGMTRDIILVEDLVSLWLADHQTHPETCAEKMILPPWLWESAPAVRQQPSIRERKPLDTGLLEILDQTERHLMTLRAKTLHLVNQPAETARAHYQY